MKTIGERIVDLRESKDMKQKVLAKRLGITAGQLSRIEKGETTTFQTDFKSQSFDKITPMCSGSA